MSRIQRLVATFAVLGLASLLAACGNSTVTTTDANGITTTKTVPYGSPITINVGGVSSAAASTVMLDGVDITGRNEQLTVHRGDSSKLRVSTPGRADTNLTINGPPARQSPPAYTYVPPSGAAPPPLAAAPPPPLVVEPPRCIWKYGRPQVDAYGYVVSHPYLHCPT